MENYILKSLNLANMYINNKHYLNIKNKTLLSIFSETKEENQQKKYKYSQEEEKFIVDKIIYKKLIFDLIEGYIEFTYPTKEFSKDYIELDLKDLNNYSKIELILLYEGWRIYDGLDIDLLKYNKDEIFINGKGLRHAEFLNLPNKQCKLKEYNLN